MLQARLLLFIVTCENQLFSIMMPLPWCRAEKIWRKRTLGTKSAGMCKSGPWRRSDPTVRVPTWNLKPAPDTILKLKSGALPNEVLNFNYFDIEVHKLRYRSSEFGLRYRVWYRPSISKFGDFGIEGLYSNYSLKLRFRSCKTSISKQFDIEETLISKVETPMLKIYRYRRMHIRYWYIPIS